MNNLIDHGRAERNLTWQVRTDPDYHEHRSRVSAIIEDGGVLRRCIECGCALLHHEPLRIAGAKALARCPSCGSLEAE